MIEEPIRTETRFRRRIAVGLLYVVFNTQAAELRLDTIRLPLGFHIAVFARVPQARTMALSPSGTLYVGTGSKSVFEKSTEGFRTRFSDE